QNFPSLVGDMVMADNGAQISNLNLYATNIDKSLQKVDYQYNIRGWLTDINDVDSNARTPALFNFHINYDNTVEGDAAAPGQAVSLYNGNISQTIWRSANADSQKRTYGYKYDALNRINTAYSRKGTNLTDYDHFNVSGIDYDKNGNIQSLTRQADYNGNALNMDDLVYSYSGNQLLNVGDNGHVNLKNEGFFDGNTTGDDYIYDVNGNMIIDRNKGITDITYNHLNLPTSVEINTTDPDGDLQDGTITYIYDATGVKLAKVLQDDIQNSTITTSYAGGYIYENNNGTEALKMFPHPEGYIEPVYGTEKSIEKFNKETGTSSFSGYQYAFNYTDHLGNVRLTYSDSDGDGAIEPKTEIISEKNYYPFGLQQKGYNDVVTSNVNSVANRFGFGNKELGEELGLDWYDISARNYDPAIGRWMNLDPLAELMRRHSPYNYAFDNPVFFQDPDGMMPQGCCPNPFAGIGEGIANSVTTAINNTSEKVSNAWNSFTSGVVNLFSPGNEGGMGADGGVVFYIEGSSTKEGLSTPNTANPGADVNYIDATGVMNVADSQPGTFGSDSKAGDLAQSGGDLLNKVAPEFIGPIEENGGSISNSGSEEPTVLKEELPFSTFMMTFKDGSKTTFHEGNNVQETIKKGDSIMQNDPKVDSLQIKTFFATGAPPPGFKRTEVDTTLQN
ncbi:RHS repeat-associated core domain-containing protein, partial [Dokdonia sp.]